MVLILLFLKAVTGDQFEIGVDLQPGIIYQGIHFISKVSDAAVM
jgi:hypothetical protein